ncbi:melatonin receptor type 1B-B-like [Amphiura filiformis]|uniref:melatonin receptor type 1B-B-like n=1 Tax=Amphiura filiformis TaxID=82378 RepID=UPI003B20BEC3
MADADDLSYMVTSTMDTFIYNGTITPEPHDITFAQRIVIGICVLLVCIFGFLGNSLTIFAVILSKKLRTTTNVFVAHLAIADLLSCLFQPWDAIGLWSMDGWPLPEWICTLSSGISLVCLCFTVVDLALIAINRYLKIMFLLRTYQKIYSVRNIVIMLTIGWLYCFCVVIIPPCFGIGRIGYSYDLKTCASDETNRYSSLYTAVCAALIYPIPLIIVIFCYTKIFLYVRRHQKIINMRRKSTGVSLRREGVKPPDSQQIQITKNLMYVVVAFLVCLGPFTISIAIDSLKTARHWTGLLALSNSAVNPVIYGLKHPGFREVFSYILKGQWKYIPEPASFVHQFRSTAGKESMRSPSIHENKKLTISRNDNVSISIKA